MTQQSSRRTNFIPGVVLLVLLIATIILVFIFSRNSGEPASAQTSATSVPTSKAAASTVTPTPQNSVDTPRLVVYMQMGGSQGDPTTLARTKGAEAAAKDLNVKLIEQYSGWNSSKMVDQFKEAIAGKPDGIVIMGHPGESALSPLVDDAESQGIVVTSGNNPLPNIETKYRAKGFGYAGADPYEAGTLTATAMLDAGLKAGNSAVIYDIWHSESRRLSPMGMYDTLTKAGIKVDKLDMSDEVDSDASQGIPVLTAYLAAHPEVKGIGTQNGNVTANLSKILQAAGKRPGEIITGGIDLSQPTIDGIQGRWISVTFDQVLYLQGYYPVQQIWLTKNYLLPGLHINTGVGTVTTNNIAGIAALIKQGVR